MQDLIVILTSSDCNVDRHSYHFILKQGQAIKHPFILMKKDPRPINLGLRNDPPLFCQFKFMKSILSHLSI